MAKDTSRTDRQHEWAARGVGTDSATLSDEDRPASPRRRRPTLAVLAVLLIVGGAAAAGLLAARLDSRQPVLVMAQDVPAGTEITTDLLATTDVAAYGLKLVPRDQAGQVLGTYTTVPLAEGQLLETPSLTNAEPFAANTAQVGVPLRASSAPDGLRSGDLVRLVRIGVTNKPPVAIATALVLSTNTDTRGGTLGGDDQPSSSASVLVPIAAADATIDAAANERLGIALVQRGVSVTAANLVTLGAVR